MQKSHLKKIENWINNYSITMFDDKNSNMILLVT